MKQPSRNIGTILLRLLLIGISAATLPGFSMAQSEFPQEGLVVKMAVEKNGVYRISYDELRAQGFTSPEQVGVFGFGGALLSESLAEAPEDFFPAVPVLHHDEALFFYGLGPSSLRYDTEKKALYHVGNHYASQGYYFLTDALPLKPLEKTSLPASGSPVEAGYYNGYYCHEAELYSLKQSGRLLVGEALANGSKLSLNVETSSAVLEDGSARIRLGYVSLPSRNGTLTLSLGGSVVISDEISRSEDRTPETYLRGIYHLREESVKINAREKIPFELQFVPASERANLDFLAVETHNRLAYGDGGQFGFRRTAEQNSSLRFRTESFPAEARIWAVFSPNDIREVELSGGEFVANPMKEDGQPVEFAAFTPEDAYSPNLSGRVTFRQIRQHEGIPDLIIISTGTFFEEARRLGNYHRDKRGLNVLVVSAEEVYNEFSSGTPDATAYRLLSKYFYDRWREGKGLENADECPINLLLFGDGAADNRLLSNDWEQLKNSGVEMLLTYESENSLNVDSFVTDDYFTFVCEGEDDLHYGAKTSALGVGRFTVRTPYEARAAVDKSISYGENKLLGDWKLRSAMVADDGDGYGHLRRGEELSEVIREEIPSMLMTKVYFDAFPKENVSGLTTFPGAKRKLQETLQKGVLVLNYTGHGNPYAWSDEQILTISDIRQFDFPYLPLWITATCDFANYDNPVTSGGEEAFLNPTSGAIGLVTTSRVVYDIYNQQLNTALLRQIFRQDGSGKNVSFGQALKRAKNKLRNTLDPTGLINKMHFFLIGDPALSLNIPTHWAVVETINDKPANAQTPIEFNALQKVKVTGSIRNHENSIEGNFSGEMAVTVFDGEVESSTLPANRPDYLEKDATFKDYSGLIYAGKTQVKDGFFEVNFTIPKDVSFHEGTTRINLYAYSSESHLEAMGVDFSSRIISGGTQSLNDTVPPEIRHCFLNDSTATDGFLTGPTPIFYAEVYDESGINLSSGGLGHQVTLVIDNREDYTFILNDYYKASALEAGVGTITFMLDAIEEGDHEAKFTVWDVFNNVSTHSFRFRVHNQLRPTLIISKLYPNPLSSEENISIEVTTDTPGEQFEGSIEIIDFTGRTLYQSESKSFKSTLEAPAQLTFNPTTSYGTRLPEGLYLLRLTATCENGSVTSATTKLVVKGNNSFPSSVE